MPLPNQKKDEIPKPAEESQAKILEQLNQISDTQKKTNAMQKFMEDPDVALLLSKKNANKKVRILDEDEELPVRSGKKKTEEEEEEEDQDPEDIENLSNREMMKLMEKKHKRQLGKEIKAAQEPLLQHIKLLTQHLQQKHQQEVEGDIASLFKRYSDAEALAPDMAQARPTLPGLTLEELYHVVKARKKGDGTNVSLFSERPTGVAARPNGEERKPPEKPKELPQGKRGIGELIKYGVAKATYDYQETLRQAQETVK